MSKFKMSLDLNILNHLGINLYSSIPPVLSEIVANSWDADAKNVHITWNKEKGEITIADDGIGMTDNDINKKYLTVGYAKRKNNEMITSSGRPVMGRKGIGKLSIFSIAEEVELYSIKDTIKSAFKMDIASIKECIHGKNSIYTPEEIPFDDEVVAGTKIVLKKIKKRMQEIGLKSLKKRVARRFTVISPNHNFNVSINGENITVEDREYFDKVQCAFLYENDSYKVEDMLKNAEDKQHRDTDINNQFNIHGWIGTAAQTTQLSTEDGNINKIVIIVRGKVAQEDVLASFNIGSIFSKYVFGEISADFLDDDNSEDIATSSRQQIIEDDPRFILLMDFIKQELRQLQITWESFRDTQGTNKALEFTSVKAWFDTLDKNNQKKAKQLFGKINKMKNTVDEQKTLLKHGILAFETLKHKNQLEILDNINEYNIDDMLTIFESHDDVEASLYYQIARGRVNVIDKLRDHVDENELEKIIQKFIFKNLWLLDPMWERAVAADPSMEIHVEKLFKDLEKKLTTEEKRARIDIQYKTSLNKHIIIELKRSSVQTNTLNLISQVEKYHTGLTKVIKQHNDGKNPEIEIICIVGKDLTDWSNEDGRKRSQDLCKPYNIKILQYNTLISNSYKAYGEYIEATTKASDIQKILDELEKEMAD